MIPSIDISPLFAPPSRQRDETDRAIRDAAGDLGFLLVTGLPFADLLTPASGTELKRIFALSDAEKRRMMRVNFEPGNRNVYRGWYPLQKGSGSYKEGIDIGPDLAHERLFDWNDPLTEPTTLPEEAALPGWRSHAASYYRAMERTGSALMGSIARGLGLEGSYFEPMFRNGISSFRLAHYPERTAESFGDADPDTAQIVFERREMFLTGAPHADSGFVTLLLQDGVPGLQVCRSDGVWLTVPPTEGSLVVNFGKLLERWTSGVYRATQHRVVSFGEDRYSIPFFFEPAVDAEISPLPINGAQPFEPFSYGDFLWEATTRFVEQRGIAHLRTPKGPPTA